GGGAGGLELASDPGVLGGQGGRVGGAFRLRLVDGEQQGVQLPGDLVVEVNQRLERVDRRQELVRRLGGVLVGGHLGGEQGCQRGHVAGVEVVGVGDADQPLGGGQDCLDASRRAQLLLQQLDAGLLGCGDRGALLRDECLPGGDQRRHRGGG